MSRFRKLTNRLIGWVFRDYILTFAVALDDIQVEQENILEELYDLNNTLLDLDTQLENLEKEIETELNNLYLEVTPD